MARLERNKERRQAREKQKGILPTDGADEAAAEAGSPGTPASGIHKSAGGTSRKCANCGQVGHIKTNKKYGPSFTLSLFSARWTQLALSHYARPFVLECYANQIFLINTGFVLCLMVQ